MKFNAAHCQSEQKESPAASKNRSVENTAKKYKNMEVTLEQNYIAKETINRTNGAFGEKIGIFGAWFGCWHAKLSRPFSNAKESYRACLNCGARRRFNAETLKTFGVFYYPPTISLIKNKR